MPTGPQPRCGNCGYDVRYLSTPRCPECGNDLTKFEAIKGLGLTKPRAWCEDASLVILLLIFSPCFATVISGLVSSLVSGRSVVWDAEIWVDEGRAELIYISTRGTEIRNHTDFDSARTDVLFDRPPYRESIIIDLKTMTIEHSSYSPSIGKPADLEAIRELLQRRWPDWSDDEIHERASTLLAVLESMSEGTVPEDIPSGQFESIHFTAHGDQRDFGLPELVITIPLFIGGLVAGLAYTGRRFERLEKQYRSDYYRLSRKILPDGEAM